jgi:pimeloyl-ACP methyl ester carboxylesterase
MVLAASGNNARGFWRPENMTPELVRTELTRTLDATSGAELRQLAQWVRGGGLCGEWRSALENVTAPTLVMAGAKDGVSTVDGVLEGSRHIGARIRRFMVVPGAGHNDLRVGHKAVTEVYPALDQWLAGNFG